MGAATAKYIQIAELLATEIRAGRYLHGEKFLSRSQLVEQFRIGAVTAVRVQNYLEKLALIRKARGSGVFVNYDRSTRKLKNSAMPEKTVKRIIELRFQGGSGFPDEIYAGIEETVARLGIEYQVCRQKLLAVSPNRINMMPVDPEAGYIVFAGGPRFLLHSALVLLSPFVHNVLLDGMIPGCNCVISNSFDGMGKLIEYAASVGCRRFLFAENFTNQPGDYYNSERRDAAAWHCSRLNFRCELVSSGIYPELFAVLEAHKEVKTVVMFPQDEPALRFKALMHSRPGLGKVLVTGFDDYCTLEPGLEQLTTIRVDRRGMGRTGVEILAAPPGRRKQIVRLSGELMIRD